MKLDTLGKRLIHARELKDWSQNDLIEHSGVPQGTLSKIERDDQLKSGKYVAVLAEVLEVRTVWLSDGIGKMIISSTNELSPPNYGLGNTRPTVNLIGDIPLIDWATAGGWADLEDPLVVGEAEAYYSTTKKHGPQTYALRVIGNSMQNSEGRRPTYFDGDIIVIDPDQACEAANTSRVIALMADDSLPMERRVTFKQLIIDGPQQYLKPLNDTYNPIHDEFVVIGLVINVISE